MELEELLMTDRSIPSLRRLRASAAVSRLAAALVVVLSGPAPTVCATPAMPGELIETKPALPVPELTLTTLADEQPASLAEYRGRPMVVNLWATWCGPCVREMPSLAHLAADMKDRGLAVIAISEDRGGKFVVDPFLKDHDIHGLPIYLDKAMSTGKAFKSTTTLPMTILIDASGMEVGRVFGDRDWDTTESEAELVRVLGLGG
jgi:thiol-disulfide isomerase/thioredoxin